MDKSRLINGQIFDDNYFEHLVSEIQEIRAYESDFDKYILEIEEKTKLLTEDE